MPKLRAFIKEIPLLEWLLIVAIIALLIAALTPSAIRHFKQPEKPEEYHNTEWTLEKVGG